MSSGAFELAKYETDKGQIVPIRVQPETEGLTLNGGANTQAAGSQTPGFPQATHSGSYRRAGTHARTVTVRMLAVPSGTQIAIGSLIRLPVFKRDVWDAYSIGNEGTYLGAACRFAGKRAEVVK
jgi:hypothetical protein